MSVIKVIMKEMNNPREIVKLLKRSDEKYHNEGIWLLSDVEYDNLKDRLKELSPNNPYFKKIGHNPPEKFKVKLPYFLGSQDKIKYNETKELNKWFDTYNSPKSYVITEKLDGISCLITNTNNKIKIYTRGNGKEGMDISEVYTYISSFPHEIPEGIAVRGELVISKENWEKIKETGTNPRNVVAGIINRKIIDKKILPLIDFVAYDLINNRNLNLEDGLTYMKSTLGFKVVKHLVLNKRIENEELFIILKDFKKTSEYEIDGIVITHNKHYDITNDKNPKYSFAFKANIILEELEVEVIDVIWNVSKDKYLKPVIKFNPVVINGITIKQTTGFNADFILKNKIGIGSIIKIQRSGDVIPHITGIVKKANEPLLPKDMSYNWNKSKIDIILDTDEKNKEQDIKSFAFFMKSLNIKGVSEGIIKKLYENSYDTIAKIIHITKEQLLLIEGFKEKSSENLLSSLHEIHGKTCKEIMIASNIIGRGLGNKKLELIINTYPYICDDDKNKSLELTIDDIKKIKGMGDITSKLFIENLKNFYDFYEDLNLNKKEREKERKEEREKERKEERNKKIENKYFVFTGFRNKTFEDYIIMNKGHIDNTITKNTNFLVVKDKTKITNKITNAIEKGIQILTIEEFEDLMKT